MKKGGYVNMSLAWSIICASIVSVIVGFIINLLIMNPRNIIYYLAGGIPISMSLGLFMSSIYETYLAKLHTTKSTLERIMHENGNDILLKILDSIFDERAQLKYDDNGEKYYVVDFGKYNKKYDRRMRLLLLNLGYIYGSLGYIICSIIHDGISVIIIPAYALLVIGVSIAYIMYNKFKKENKLVADMRVYTRIVHTEVLDSITTEALGSSTQYNSEMYNKTKNAEWICELAKFNIIDSPSMLYDDNGAVVSNRPIAFKFCKNLIIHKYKKPFEITKYRIDLPFIVVEIDGKPRLIETSARTSQINNSIIDGTVKRDGKVIADISGVYNYLENTLSLDADYGNIIAVHVVIVKYKESDFSWY